MIRLFTLKIAKRRSYKYYKLYKKNQYQDLEWVKKDQLTKLKEIIRFAYDNNNFYKKLWDENKVDINIKSLDDIENFPIVTKEDLKRQEESLLVSEPFKKKKNVIDYTTGSTGNPFKVIKNRNCAAERFGLSKYLGSWYYNMPGTAWVRLWRANLKPTFFDKIKFFFSGQYVISIYDPTKPNESALDSQRLNEILSEIESKRPPVIEGFVSALTLFANHMLTNNINLSYQLKSIVTGAEQLEDNDREQIEKAFNCHVYNRYGGTETSAIAHECHVQSDSNHYLHILDGHCLVESEKGTEELIITDFYSRALPLIRYKNGDKGVIKCDFECSCGISGGIITNLLGRTNDAIKLPNGKMISSHLWHNYMKKCPNLIQYQIIQYQLDKVVIKYIISSTKNNEEDSLLLVKNLVENALTNVNVDWEKVDRIPPSSGGKITQVVSYVK
ncbi:phenylacetate--CoA ligase family protein [Marivirga tractuosa]|uniref:phenylacetate--CoA ligase family protein n=1 Tax=Marivirga tractuosa TaxID=1006 RepID=UPI0003100647|nr:phenylacetate--CoA ligase family protein [Marivirga tractuosa]